MKLNRKDYFNLLILLIISIFLVFDLFINKGQPATFDGPTHLTNIGMFFKSIKAGNWHVTWTDGFANYGMPIGLLAQQTTSYLGAVINLLTNNIILSYNLVTFIGALLSVVLFFLFLRIYFKPEAALMGAYLFNFAPYRIINIYIRGALPEFFVAVSLPLMLIGIYFLTHKNSYKGFLLVITATTSLILTHPMMFVINGFIFGPYFLLNLYKNKTWLKDSLVFVAGLVTGFGLSGYYLMPLVLENKYFYYGLSKNHFVENQFMTMKNFFDPNWYYFYHGDIFTRGHLIKSGLIETLILIVGASVAVWMLIKRKKLSGLFMMTVCLSFLLIFLMTPYAVPLYKKINLLASIQHQWRLFTAFIFLPPVILAFFLNKTGNKYIFLAVILIITFARFPQLYGKNYTLHKDTDYLFTLKNLHGNILNTIWTGPTQDYPKKDQKVGVIEGRAGIKNLIVKNNIRSYDISAESDVRMVDFTFYFPGWKAYVDGQEKDIQFQDPQYRGVITYNVPKGDHRVEIKFTDTKPRKLGNIVTLLSVGLLLAFIILRRVMPNLFSR